MLSCCSPYTLKNTQETLCFKKYSTDVLFCTSQLSSRHNPTRVTKPSSRGSCGKGSLMTCQLAALCHITWNKENVERAKWRSALENGAGSLKQKHRAESGIGLVRKTLPLSSTCSSSSVPGRGFSESA